MATNIIPNDDVLRMAEKEEPRFLNILLRDKDALASAIAFGIKPSENNKPGHFLHPRNNFLYSLMYKNFLKYNSILTRSAMDSLVDMQSSLTDEEKAASKGYWDKVWNRHDVAPEDFLLLRNNVNDRYALWQFYERWRDGDKIIHATTNHAKLIKEFISRFTSIDSLSPDQYSLTMDIKKGIENALVYIDKRRNCPEEIDTLMTGIRGIDKVYHGFAKGSYTVISGIVNGGKTTLMMNIGFNMAKMGKRVAYVSLEKDANLFFRRILSLHALTDYNRIKEGGTGNFGLTDFWYGKLKEAAKDLIDNTNLSFHCLQFVQDTPLTKILSEVDKLNNVSPLDVLIVDYLGVIGIETKTVGRHDIDLANIHKRLMAYGREHHLATFTALQIKNSSTKDIRNKAKKVVNDTQLDTVAVNTEDYSGSQSIIADADNGIGVVLSGDNPSTKMFVFVSKARDDASKKTIALDFDGRLSRVSDPQYGAAQIVAVTKELYGDKTTTELEDELASDEKDLFSAMDKVEEDKSKGKKQKKEEKLIEPKESKEVKETEEDKLKRELFTTTTTTPVVEKSKEETEEIDGDDDFTDGLTTD